MRHLEYMKKKFKELEEKSKEQKVKYFIETIDAIKAMTDTGFEYYLQGNIMKYLWRYRYKNGAEDLKKAQWYLSELISVVEDEDKS